jgi:hypothetical protein
MPLKMKEVLPSAIIPSHYHSLKIEPSYFIAENEMDWFQGNILKYVCRHKMKNKKEDLLKAQRYLEMYIKREYDNDPLWWQKPA